MEVFKGSDAFRKREWYRSANRQFDTSMPGLLEQEYQNHFEHALSLAAECDFVGFTCFHSNMATVCLMAERLKREKPEIKIILGGPEMLLIYKQYGNNLPENCFPFADFIVVGEGEKPLLEHIRGRTCGRTVVFDEITDISMLPFPEYCGCNLSDYGNGYKIPVQFSRGCINHCRFCTERFLVRKHRLRAAAGLVREMIFHREKNPGSSFVFSDSMLNADVGQFEVLLDAIMDTIGPVPWEAQIAVRPDMTDTVLGKMKESGCYNLFVGLESGSGATLKRMRKGYSPQDAVLFFQKLKNAGLQFGISLITGFPGETPADYQESMDFLMCHRDLIPRIEQINPHVPIPWETGNGPADTTGLERTRQTAAALSAEGYKIFPAFIGNLVNK